MGRDETYSLISVNAGDDEEIVIQTGVRRQAESVRSEPAGEASEGAGVSAGETVAIGDADAACETGRVDAEADEADGVPLDAGETDCEPRPSKPRYRETTKDELDSVEPMSSTQKTVIGCVLLFIVGFAVYYLFLR